MQPPPPPAEALYLHGHITFEEERSFRIHDISSYGRDIFYLYAFMYAGMGQNK